jgi:hypothetical protein
MVKKGDSFKDIELYIRFRINHLDLERQKVRFVIEEDKREQVHRKFDAKIEELRKTLSVLNGDIKEAAKFEYSKCRYLNEKKVENLKRIQKETKQ